MNGMAIDLSGKAAAVSGSGRGIGRAIALELARAGADVAVFSRTEEEFRGTAAAIEDMGRKALALRVDMMEPGEVNAMVEKVLGEFGRLDIMVNNAGTSPSYDYMENVITEDYAAIMDTNIRGTFLCNQRVIPAMKEQGGGCIINVASLSGLKALFKCSAYSASKGAIIALTRTMAVELARFNIRVNALCPGYMRTRMMEGLLAYERSRQRIELSIPMRRVGEAEEIAPMAAFLASDAASYITGAAICVDGGLSAT
ncbi:MAG: SDR family oxidoreductase [Actinobacteria bacterium]|nr:SDR family oxidoreductase [Actinomycetota bacterium]